jgi:hypothetical protein
MEHYSTEAEQYVLGRALLDANDMAVLAESLPLECLYKAAHRRIYSTMLELYTAGNPANILTVGNLIEDRNQVSDIESTAYLNELCTVADTFVLADTSPLSTYVDIIVKHATKEQTKLLYAKAQAMASEGADGPSVLAYIADGLERIAGYGKPSEAAVKPYAGLTLSEMDGMPEMDWYITGILPDHVTAGVFGDSESGKSLIVQDWMMRTALGWKWRGRDVKQGHVWYIAGEGYMGIRYRMHAWLQQYNVTSEAIDPYIHVVGQGVPLMHPLEVSKLIARIKELDYSDQPLRLVVLDTLSRCMEGGDENDNSDMRDALVQAERIHRETGAVVLIIHHAGKNEQYRGASAFRANLDTVLKVEQRDGKVLMYCDKQKDGAPKFGTIASEIASVSKPEWEEQQISFPVLVPSEYEPPQEVGFDPRGNMRIMLLILGRNMLSFSEWKTACSELGVNEASFKERLKRARDKRLIVQDKNGGYSLSEESFAWFENQDDGLPGDKNKVSRIVRASEGETIPKLDRRIQGRDRDSVSIDTIPISPNASPTPLPFKANPTRLNETQRGASPNGSLGGSP